MSSSPSNSFWYSFFPYSCLFKTPASKKTLSNTILLFSSFPLGQILHFIMHQPLSFSKNTRSTGPAYSICISVSIIRIYFTNTHTTSNRWEE